MSFRNPFARRLNTVWEPFAGIRWWGGWYSHNDVAGLVLPRWLGRAADAWEWNGVLLLPIPLNKLYSAVAWAYRWLRSGLREEAIRVAYRQGQEDGYRLGLGDGERMGRSELLDELEALNRKMRVPE